jgi:hypothetical protein
MSKTIYRMTGIIVACVLALGGFTKAEAIRSQPAASRPVYAYYYLWWSTKHWQDKLGANYPYSSSPVPLPATTDADGCNAVSSYAGNQLLDVPTRLISQDEPGAIENDIRTAKNAGITGFWLNWSGDGTTSQTRTSVSYTRRLSEAFAASARVGGFRNWVSYKAAAGESANYIINDLNFLYNTFKNESAWERIDGKPVVTFTGSRKYSTTEVQKISNAVRDRIFLVGDETRSTLTSTRMAMFDAITYYWSTQDPYGNPQSFDQIKEIGDRVRAAGKRWYAPLNPGYNSSLLNKGTCIPRRNGETLRAVWNGNLASNPDGWGFISWNEIAENSHIVPMQKWGSTHLNVLASLIASDSQPLPATPIPTSPPATTNKLDDADPALSYSGTWARYNAVGPYAGTLTYSTAVNSSATFRFEGSKFTLYYTQFIDRGVMKIYVDNATTPVATLNQNGSLVWQKTWTSQSLGSGVHTVKLVHAAGDFVDVDAIQIETSSTPGTANKLDDINAAFAYSSSAWQDVTTSKAYGGSYKETTRSGSFVTLPFNGQSFSIIYKGGSTYGKINIYVDDVLVGTLNQKLSTATYQKRWDYPGQLSAGNHTLKLVFEAVSSTVNRGSLDAVMIQ